MMRNYFNIAWRNIKRNKVYSLINVGGLVVGISVCLLTFLFIRYEKGFDRFQPDSVYRLCSIKQEEGFDAPRKTAGTMFPMGPTLKAEFPEIKDFARVVSLERVPLQQPGEAAVMGTWCGADASFFHVFNFKLVKGDAATALQEPGSIVLTEKLSRQLFGSKDPMGQVVRNQGRDTVDYMVTGILQDIADQSHLQFDAIYSFSSALIAGESSDWNMDWMYTYLLLEDGTNINTLEAKFPAYLQKYMESQKATRYQLFLQSVRDIHLWSGDISNDLPGIRKFNGSYLYLLAAVALFVLALATINYINLTTARSTTRAKEVGIRKTSGAGRIQVASQFLSEAMVVSLIAVVLSFIFVHSSLPLVREFSGSDVQFNVLREPFWLLAGGGIVVGVGLMAGLIPAWLMSGVRPVKILTGRLWASSRSPLRNALVILQFTIAVGLSMSTLSAFRQLKFMQRYDAGFSKEEVLVAQVSWTDRQRVEALMGELRQIPGVQGVTGSLRRLGDAIDQIEIVFQDADHVSRLKVATMFVDYNYIPFYQIELLAGRNLSSRFGNDRQGNSYLINETLARKLLVEAGKPKAPLSGLIGKGFRYSFQDSTGTIIGITRDFNFNSLHHPMEPLCMNYLWEYYFKELSIRIDGSRRAEVLSAIEQHWKNSLPDQEFDYYFLDKYMERLYRNDTQTSKFVAALTMLAIFISCLGLIGLAAFNIERRVKEIGVRRVHGASVPGIVTMLSKDFIKLVVIAVMIATPLAYYAMHKWLENFAYKTNLSWWIFALAGVMALGVALLTVLLQSYKAATQNPVNTLRYE
jgi:putative ABC transport system permease protein